MNRSGLDQTCINAIRVLTIDAVQKANSGHCGLPMAMAPVGYLLYTRFMRHNPRNPEWYGRDRFVLSAGHGSMLLYSLLYLTGYDLSLDDLKQFRQLGSKTPGHPEHGVTEGVETTTGPLGQGFGNGVGMAMAAKHLEARFERDNSGLFDHRIFGICSDGDLMEGVASEAASIAGHLGLGNIVYIYDDNHVTIDGHTELSFDEDVCKRFDAYKWHTQVVEDANDLAALSKAIENGIAETSRPSLIRVRSIIGYGSPHKQGTSAAHSNPLGVEEVKLTKEFYGYPTEPPFFVPDDALAYFRRMRRAWRGPGAGVEREVRGLLQKKFRRGRRIPGGAGERSARQDGTPSFRSSRPRIRSQPECQPRRPRRRSGKKSGTCSAAPPT